MRLLRTIRRGLVLFPLLFLGNSCTPPHPSSPLLSSPSARQAETIPFVSREATYRLLCEQAQRKRLQRPLSPDDVIALATLKHPGVWQLLAPLHADPHALLHRGFFENPSPQVLFPSTAPPSWVGKEIEASIVESHALQLHALLHHIAKEARQAYSAFLYHQTCAQNAREILRPIEKMQTQLLYHRHYGKADKVSQQLAEVIVLEIHLALERTEAQHKLSSQNLRMLCGLHEKDPLSLSHTLTSSLESPASLENLFVQAQKQLPPFSPSTLPAPLSLLPFSEKSSLHSSLKKKITQQHQALLSSLSQVKLFEERILPIHQYATEHLLHSHFGMPIDLISHLEAWKSLYHAKNTYAETLLFAHELQRDLFETIGKTI